MSIRAGSSGAGRPTSPEPFASSHRPGPILDGVRTGILGGTFDPIHIGHLHAGEVALAQLNLDRVLFMPAGDPWQKEGRAVSSAVHRLAMTRLAVQAHRGFEVDTREIDREGSTFTIDTLESFPLDEELFLIVGSDAVAGIETWHRPEDILARVTLAIAPRPGIDIIEVARAHPEAVVLDMAPLDISSTNIRLRARLGSPYRFLVHPTVADYIEVNDVYREAPRGDRVGESNSQEERS